LAMITVKHIIISQNANDLTPQKSRLQVIRRTQIQCNRKKDSG